MAGVGEPIFCVVAGAQRHSLPAENWGDRDPWL